MLSDPDHTPAPARDGKNLRVAGVVLSLVVAMGGLAYASVPLYQLFCQVTGYGGTTQRAENPEGIPVLDREIVVRFDSNLSQGLNWRFKPERREITVKLGELAQVSYLAENLSEELLTGTATFNVTPASLGAYFNKTECFCFTETEIEPGGRLEMPVVFFIDPELDQEPDLAAIKSVTLSYTFFPAETEPATPKRMSTTELVLDKQSGKL